MDEQGVRVDSSVGGGGGVQFVQCGMDDEHVLNGVLELVVVVVRFVQC